MKNNWKWKWKWIWKWYSHIRKGVGRSLSFDVLAHEVGLLNADARHSVNQLSNVWPLSALFIFTRRTVTYVTYLSLCRGLWVRMARKECCFTYCKIQPDIVWVIIWGEMVNFVGYQSEKWDPKSQSVPVCFFQSSSVHLYTRWLKRHINDFSVIWWLWSPLLLVPRRTIIMNQRLEPGIHHLRAKWSHVQ